jgi:cardiolipin synthase
LAEATTGVTPLVGNSCVLLDSFDQVLDRLIEDIDNAKEFCDLEFYIWSAGGRADELAAALLRASQRGVTCRLLLDDVGSRSFLRSVHAGELRKGGVHLQAAMHANLFRMLFVRFDLRLHRKIVIIDKRSGRRSAGYDIPPRLVGRDGRIVDRAAGGACRSVDQR